MSTLNVPLLDVRDPVCLSPLEAGALVLQGKSKESRSLRSCFDPVVLSTNATLVLESDASSPERVTFSRAESPK